MKGKLNIKHFFVLVTTLVLVLLQPLHALQHVYYELTANHGKEQVDTKHKHTDHSHSKKCTVCEFTIHPFLVAETFCISNLDTQQVSKQYFALQTEYYLQTYSYNYLRGPPAYFLV